MFSSVGREPWIRDEIGSSALSGKHRSKHWFRPRHNALVDNFHHTVSRGRFRNECCASSLGDREIPLHHHCRVALHRCRTFAAVIKQNRALFLTTQRALQISNLSLIAPLAVGLAFSGCTTGTTPLASSDAPSPSAGVSIGQRDLTPEEKKVIMDAVAPALRNPGSAKYHWANFPAVVTEDSVNYCATVDAQSPHAAYNGRQAYIIKAQMSGNRVSSAVIGLVAGGKDFEIVTKMCAKYGLDPRNAS